MPQWVATLIVCVVTILMNALVTAFYYGRLTQKVEGHREQLEGLASDKDQQWSQINKLREDVGKVKGRLGVNGA